MRGLALLAVVVLLAALPIKSPAQSDAEILQELRDVFSAAAVELSNGRWQAFLDRFDDQMPEYGEFRRKIEALSQQNDVGSVIEIRRAIQTKDSIDLTLRWKLHIRSKMVGQPVEVREEVVTCNVRRAGKEWRISEIAPRKFFDPPVPSSL